MRRLRIKYKSSAPQYSLLITNCGQILTMAGRFPKKGKAMSDLGIIENGFIACSGDRIAMVKPMRFLDKAMMGRETKMIDAQGNVVMPGLIDCHTHLVFAGNRAREWQMRKEGKSYLDILAAGGGILSTVRATRAASERELMEDAITNLKEMLAIGVTTVEAKSGYGLDFRTEIKILKILKKLGKKTSVRIVPTFLGAHAVPPEFKGDAHGYLRFLEGTVLPKVKGLAEFVDIFCEKGAFSLAESRDYLSRAKEMGFKLKIHGEQINRLGACAMAAQLGAVSADHCDNISEKDMKVLAKYSTVAVLLPLASFFMGEKKSDLGRKLVDAGVPVAISTDFNPGSAPCKNLPLAMALPCLRMGLTVEEALTAVTVNAACALDRGSQIGSLEAGKEADILITNADDYREIIYRMGDGIADKVIIGGKLGSLTYEE